MIKNKRIWQYWSTHIILSIALALISILIMVFLNKDIIQIQRSTIPFLSTILSTLLGLTFTAFSILVAVTPNIRKDFIETTTFENIGKTFYLTLLIQFIADILSFFLYILFDTNAFYLLMDFTIILSIYSFGFLFFLIRDIFVLFKGIRNKILH